MNQFSGLTKIIFHKDSVEQCTMGELQNMVKQYPYFAGGHLILAEKMRGLDISLYQQQIKKASLYFTNPLWLDFMLKKENQENQEILESVEKDTLHDNEVQENMNIPSEPVEESSPALQGREVQKEFTSSPVSEPVEERSDEVDAEARPGNSFEENESGERGRDPLMPALNTDLRILPVEATKNDILFEPYHTVDYFASQGIKTVLEDKPGDRLGKQLKSFTEWLKTMKRLPEKELGQQLDKVTETKVVSLAEHSIEDQNVVTEAMAEVWIKQGNMAKAADVYRKLSLLNPSKSAYFAALIEQLKKS